MKKSLLLILILSLLGINAQSITPKNIAEVVDDINNQSRNSFLEKTGFQNDCYRKRTKLV